LRQGTARLYGPIERERLALVLRAKGLGFTLGEIRQMLDAEQGHALALNISRRQCFDQIKLLEQRKREIETALAELRRTYSSFYARVASGAA
jgi:DNA-binding transcriptional MerR regulator